MISYFYNALFFSLLFASSSLLSKNFYDFLDTGSLSKPMPKWLKEYKKIKTAELAHDYLIYQQLFDKMDQQFESLFESKRFKEINKNLLFACYNKHIYFREKHPLVCIYKSGSIKLYDSKTLDLLETYFLSDIFDPSEASSINITAAALSNDGKLAFAYKDRRDRAVLRLACISILDGIKDYCFEFRRNPGIIVSLHFISSESLLVPIGEKLYEIDFTNCCIYSRGGLCEHISYIKGYCNAPRKYELITNKGVYSRKNGSYSFERVSEHQQVIFLTGFNGRSGFIRVEADPIISHEVVEPDSWDKCSFLSLLVAAKLYKDKFTCSTVDLVGELHEDYIAYFNRLPLDIRKEFIHEIGYHHYHSWNEAMILE